MATPLMSVDTMNERIRRCAFNHWLGLEVLSADTENLSMRINWRAEMGGSPDAGTTHGGVLAAIIDATASYTAAAAVGRIGPTLDMRVDYHRGAKPGAMTASGKVVKAGRSIATVDVQLNDSAGALVASGRVVFFVQQAS